MHHGFLVFFRRVLCKIPATETAHLTNRSFAKFKEYFRVPNFCGQRLSRFNCNFNFSAMESNVIS